MLAKLAAGSATAWAGLGVVLASQALSYPRDGVPRAVHVTEAMSDHYDRVTLDEKRSATAEAFPWLGNSGSCSGIRGAGDDEGR